MKKKILSLILGAAMAVSACSLAACGKGGERAWPETDAGGDVVVAFLHMGTRPTDFDMVQSKFSEYCNQKLGFGVKFKEAVITSLEQTYTNWLAANEDVDLLNVYLSDPLAYVTDKKVGEMSSLIAESAPYLNEMSQVQKGCYIYGTDNKLYGISVFPGPNDSYGGYAYAVQKEVLQTCGLADTYTEGRVIGYDDLDTIFAGIAEHYKTNDKGASIYPCSVLNTVTFDLAINPYDDMGGSQYPLGVVMMDGKTGEWKDEVVNYYETEEFKTYVEKMGEYKEKGYVHPDAETPDSGILDLIESGQFVGGFMQNSQQIKHEWERKAGNKEFVLLPLSQSYMRMGKPIQAMMIPAKSKRPRKAMQFLNLLFEDKEFVNIVQRGVEGEHWNFVEGAEEYGIIQATEKASRYKVGGFWGDYGKIYSYASDGLPVADVIKNYNSDMEYADHYMAEANANTSPAFGFIYDTTKYNSRIKVLNTKADQYYATLAVGNGKKGSDGTYTGAGSTYAEFIDALKKSKIDDVIADKNKQYQEWKASK